MLKCLVRLWHIKIVQLRKWSFLIITRLSLNTYILLNYANYLFNGVQWEYGHFYCYSFLNFSLSRRTKTP